MQEGKTMKIFCVEIIVIRLLNNPPVQWPLSEIDYFKIRIHSSLSVKIPPFFG